MITESEVKAEAAQRLEALKERADSVAASLGVEPKRSAVAARIKELEQQLGQVKALDLLLIQRTGQGAILAKFEEVMDA